MSQRCRPELQAPMPPCPHAPMPPMAPCAYAPEPLCPAPMRPCPHIPTRPSCQITKPQVPNPANYRLQTQATPPLFFSLFSLPMLFTRECAFACAIPAALALRAPFLQLKLRFSATISVRVHGPGHYFRRSSLRWAVDPPRWHFYAKALFVTRCFGESMQKASLGDVGLEVGCVA